MHSSVDLQGMEQTVVMCHVGMLETPFRPTRMQRHSFRKRSIDLSSRHVERIMTCVMALSGLAMVYGLHAASIGH